MVVLINCFHPIWYRWDRFADGFISISYQVNSFTRYKTQTSFSETVLLQLKLKCITCRVMTDWNKWYPCNRVIVVRNPSPLTKNKTIRVLWLLSFFSVRVSVVLIKIYRFIMIFRCMYSIPQIIMYAAKQLVCVLILPYNTSILCHGCKSCGA